MRLSRLFGRDLGRDVRKTYPGNKYLKRCICGLTYDQDNWVLEVEPWKLWILLSIAAAVILLGHIGFLAIILGVVAAWAVMKAVVSLILGHTFVCALRRAVVVTWSVLLNPAQ
jgi:hypothetical protein